MGLVDAHSLAGSLKNAKSGIDRLKLVATALDAVAELCEIGKYFGVGGPTGNAVKLLLISFGWVLARGDLCSSWAVSCWIG